MEKLQNTDSLEVEVRDSEGNLKEIRFVKHLNGYRKEFLPNKLFYKILKLGSKPPMVFPLGRWKTYKENYGNS